MLEPVASVQAPCPATVVCNFSDVDGDGKADLVRRDPSGTFADPGTIAVAYGNGWGLAPPRLLANRCELDHICIVADLDGARGAELAHIARGDGKVRVERLASVGEDIELIADPLVTAGFCADADARCAAAPWDKSPGAELVWIDEAARVHAAGLGENTEVQQAPTPCDQGVQCRLAELDGSVGAEWLAWQNGEAGVRAFGADGASRFSLAADCGTDRCEFADLDGDGRTDILQADPEGTLVWSSSYEWELPLALPQAATCGTEDRCLWADLNGDRFDDLVRITPDGDVHLHPTLDARGRLEAASLALSSFSTAQWRSRIADAQAELTANLSALGPDFVPADTSALPPAVYQARRTQLMDAVASAIAEVRGSISSESEVDDDEDVRRIQEYAMFVAVGRTILAATPLGTSARGTDCANVVVHESTTDASWPQSTPSYLFAYARALRTTDRELQTQQMVDALTAIHGGFRCLNHGEIARLDAAWSDAVLETAADLADAGHEQAVRWLLDNALPITLLTFDAAKYSTIPGSYRLLRARFDGRVLVAGDVPDEGFDFEHAADDPACESFVCRSYDLPRRALANGRGLVLDRLGVWLPDPMRSGRLQRVDIDPYHMLRELQDLRQLGEGDCALLEAIAGGFMCRSARTCAAGSTPFDLTPGAAPPNPGAPDSPLTHLRTSRADLAEQNGCDGGSGRDGTGGAAGVAMAGCMGPPLDARRGRFSADPELDTIMRCALDATSAPRDLAIDLGDFCVAGDEPEGDTTENPPPDDADAPDEPETAPYTPPTEGQLDVYQDAIERVTQTLRNGGLARRMLIDAIRDNPRYAGLSEEEVGELIDGAVAEDLAYADYGVVPRGALGTATLYEAGDVRFVQIIVDVSRAFAEADKLGIDPGAYLSRTLMHEAIHAFSFHAEEKFGIARSSDDDHRITQSIDLGTQCAEGLCDSSCGIGDAIGKRFTACVEGPPGVALDDLRCSYGQDVCDDRAHGAMGFPLAGGCTPSLPASLRNPECFLVQCAVDTGPVAHLCCSAGAPESAPDGVIGRYIGPGPMPPPPVAEAFVGIWATLDAVPLP